MREDPYKALLVDWNERSSRRKLGKDEALHPSVLRRVLKDLDDAGHTEGADVIQSLVWSREVSKERERLLASESGSG